MAVVNEQTTPTCTWEQAGHLPLFVYSTLIDKCGKYQDSGKIYFASLKQLKRSTHQSWYNKTAPLMCVIIEYKHTHVC